MAKITMARVNFEISKVRHMPKGVVTTTPGTIRFIERDTVKSNAWTTAYRMSDESVLIHVKATEFQGAYTASFVYMLDCGWEQYIHEFKRSWQSTNPYPASVGRFNAQGVFCFR